MKIAGYAHCQWSETEKPNNGKKNKTAQVTYLGREDYLSTSTYIMGSDLGELKMHSFIGVFFLRFQEFIYDCGVRQKHAGAKVIRNLSMVERKRPIYSIKRMKPI